MALNKSPAEKKEVTFMALIKKSIDVEIILGIRQIGVGKSTILEFVCFFSVRLSPWLYN